MENNLRPFWRKIFDFDWKFGIFLIVLICVPRFFLVLEANASGDYKYIGMVMLISALAPFVFLSKAGWKEIGLTRPKSYRWLLFALLLGGGAAFLLYLLGQSLYGDSYQNWYKYIGKSYNIPNDINEHNKLILFSVMSVTGMIFSPIGEEFFFRGIVHSSFARSVGDKKASLVDASAFALTHISHFGLVFLNYKWQLFYFPTILWVLGMFATGIIFYLCKKFSGSLIGAISCHAAFNLVMIYCIFYLF